MKIKYKKLVPWWKFWARWKYELLEDYECMTNILGLRAAISTYATLYPSGKIAVNSGYRWDGASGPTWDTVSTMRASLEHDVFYQMMRLELLPQEFAPIADVRFRNVLVEDGCSRLRAWYYYHGVNNCFAHRAAKPR